MTPESALPLNAAPQGQLLVVEDEEALRALLVRVLTRVGYEPVAASGGQEALEAFELGPERFLAAVVDLTLPDMSGKSLIDRLRAIRRDLPVVVCSGTASSEAVFAVPGAPTRFLQKPFMPARLVEALEDWTLRYSPPSASSAS